MAGAPRRAQRQRPAVPAPHGHHPLEARPCRHRFPSSEPRWVVAHLRPPRSAGGAGRAGAGHRSAPAAHSRGAPRGPRGTSSCGRRPPGSGRRRALEAGALRLSERSTCPSRRRVLVGQGGRGAGTAGSPVRARAAGASPAAGPPACAGSRRPAGRASHPRPVHVGRRVSAAGRGRRAPIRRNWRASYTCRTGRARRSGGRCRPRARDRRRVSSGAAAGTPVAWCRCALAPQRHQATGAQGTVARVSRL